MRRDWLFTSKELDFDTGLYYYGARYYDPKTSVWQSPDPALHEYVQGEHTSGGHSIYSSGNLGLYSYAWNNPVVIKDPDGKKIVFAAGSTRAFKAEYSRAVRYLQAHGASGMVSRLAARKEIVTLKEGVGLNDNFFTPSSKEITWNPHSAMTTTSGGKRSPANKLSHEADHALAEIREPVAKAARKATSDPVFTNLEEKRVITGSETRVATKLGEGVRKDHGGTSFKVPHSDRRK